jgi:RNA polymerase primary sigma factor
MAFETSDNLPKYFRSIQKSTPLTLDEEKALAVRIKAGDTTAIHELVRCNLKIVVTIANRHIGQGVAIDDLIQEGNLGLYEAARRYDPQNDARFITYAQLWVRKYINEAVAEYGRIVRLPLNQEYERYKAKRKGEEVANLSSVAIDAPVGSENDTTVGDLLLNAQPEVEFTVEFDHNTYMISRAMKCLKERDRKIIEAYFGLGETAAVPTNQIAEDFDMTNVRVCQIVKSALTKMRETV